MEESLLPRIGVPSQDWRWAAPAPWVGPKSSERMGFPPRLWPAWHILPRDLPAAEPVVLRQEDALAFLAGPADPCLAAGPAETWLSPQSPRGQDGLERTQDLGTCPAPPLPKASTPPSSVLMGPLPATTRDSGL